MRADGTIKLAKSARRTARARAGASARGGDRAQGADRGIILGGSAVLAKRTLRVNAPAGRLRAGGTGSGIETRSADTRRAGPHLAVSAHDRDGSGRAASKVVLNPGSRSGARAADGRGTERGGVDVGGAGDRVVVWGGARSYAGRSDRIDCAGAASRAHPRDVCRACGGGGAVCAGSGDAVLSGGTPGTLSCGRGRGRGEAGREGRRRRGSGRVWTETRRVRELGKAAKREQKGAGKAETRRAAE